MAQQISFDVSPADRALIGKIVDRALDVSAQSSPIAKKHRGNLRINALMDLVACHANGNPLDLEKLLAADDFNLLHDVAGIGRHICHETGKLLNCFVPRFSARESADA